MLTRNKIEFSLTIDYRNHVSCLYDSYFSRHTKLLGICNMMYGTINLIKQLPYCKRRDPCLWSYTLTIFKIFSLAYASTNIKETRKPVVWLTTLTWGAPFVTIPYAVTKHRSSILLLLLSGVPDYFYRNKISSGGDLSHYSSASLY